MSELTHEPFDTREPHVHGDLVDYIAPAALREMLKEARAERDTWERISLALAPRLDSERLCPLQVWVEGVAEQRQFWGWWNGYKWHKFDTPRAALLAWAAQQGKDATPRAHRGISDGGDTCTDSHCWCSNPLNREY